MEAIVLAGGFGTRLAHIVKDVPKPMAEVAGRPFLEYVLSFLLRNGVNKVVLATGYKSKVIEDYFQEKFEEIKIVYSVEELPLGTGGAIKKALELCNEENVFIINGDTYFDVNLSEMAASHQLKKSEITVAIKEMFNFDRYGCVDTDINGRITKFEEKKYVERGLINGGIYIIKRNVFKDINEEYFSFENNFLDNYVRSNIVYSFISAGYFIDIGIPEDYANACDNFSCGIQINRASSGSKQLKVLFLDRDGTINRYGEYIYKIENFKFRNGMIDIIKEYNDKGWLVIVITNQAGVARGYYTEADIVKLHKWVDKELDKYGAHIDAWYYCTHHHTKGSGRYKIDCNCRKPKTGMIEQACRDFNIDLNGSILMGDKLWDIKCGQKMGIKSYMIEEN